MEATTTHFMDKAIIGLKKAVIELEEFQVQLALGKAETLEKYEEVKKKFHNTIHDAKQKIHLEKVNSGDLTKKFEEIQHSLTSGAVETKEAFIGQKEKILHIIQKIEDSLKTTGVDRDYYLSLKTEIEKFKIKMEILSLRFEMGKLEAKKEFESFKIDFGKKVEKIKLKFNEEESAIAKNWHHFTDELSEAFSHIKKAFTLS